MAKKMFYASLFGGQKSANSIDRLIESLEEYKQSLNDKTEIFRERLAEVGIKAAYAHSGQYGDSIIFETQQGGDGVTFLVGRDKNLILKEWYTDKKGKHKRSYEISPLLMAEFGSGWLAVVLYDIAGVGQGTMPGQKHASDPNGWVWYDENGVKHRSIGEPPSFPMHNAIMAMLTEVDRVAKEVYK